MHHEYAKKGGVAALGGDGRAVGGFEEVAFGSNALQLVHDYSDGLVPGPGVLLSCVKKTREFS